MTFVKKEELKKKIKLIEEYLNNRKLLKKRLQNEIQSKQQLQESASEIFLPVTKKIEETQKKTDERQDKLIKELQQNIEERPSYTIDFSDEEKQLLAQHNLETHIVELVKRIPDYIASLKNKIILINKKLGGQRRRQDTDTALIDKQISVFRKYREKLNKLLKGMELTVGRGFKSPDELCERLNLLVAAKQAGNNNNRLNKEITSILKKLKCHKCISPCNYQKLCNVILK